jgi:ATP-binding cassette subfamily B protein
MRTYQFMWRMIRFRPWLYLTNGVLWTLIHMAPLVPGLIARAFLDTLQPSTPVGWNAWSLIVLLLMVALARIVLIYAGIRVDVLHRFTMSTLLQRNLLATILARPGAQAVPESPGEAISRFRDDAEQAEDAISWTLDTIGQTLFALGAVIVLLTINVPITILVFGPLVGVVAVAYLARNRLEHYRAASRQATGQVTGLIGEMFGAVQAVQVAGAEAPVIAHFRALNETRRKAMLRDQLLSGVLDSIFANAVSLGTGLILILTAQAMRDRTFSVGDFALFVYYLTFVTDFTQWAGRFLAHYKQTSVAFARMTVLLQGAPPATLVAPTPLYLSGPLPPVPVPVRTPADRLDRLDVEGLTYRYLDSGRGVAGVDLHLRRGQFVVITGRIGAGKTTLLRALLGLLPPQAGTIRWNGTLVSDPAAWFVPPRCAYTPQIPLLFSALLRENLLLGLPGESVDLARAVQTAVLERDLAEMEAGLDTPVGAKGVKLSGGQVQRAAAARMFARQPELLVFDDLSSALDVETEALLWERIFASTGPNGDGPERPTCLVVSHRHAALQRADHIIVLRDGQVADAGPLALLLARCDEMRQLWQVFGSDE